MRIIELLRGIMSCYLLVLILCTLLECCNISNLLIYLFFFLHGELLCEYMILLFARSNLFQNKYDDEEG